MCVFTFRGHKPFENMPFFFGKFFFCFLIREKEREGEREEEKYQCVVASHVAPTGDLAHNPGMGPDWELNRRHFGLQPALDPQATPAGARTRLFFCFVFTWPDTRFAISCALTCLLNK